VELGNVLILARDEVVAALLGLMVELQGFTPRFLGPEETPEAALAGGGFASVLIDCDHPLWSEPLLRACREASAQPILFSPFRMGAEVRNLAERYGLSSFTLPTDPDTFSKLLRV
jgi:hypothetical protein